MFDDGLRLLHQFSSRVLDGQELRRLPLSTAPDDIQPVGVGMTLSLQLFIGG